MSSTESAYRFEHEGGHAVITLLPTLNDVPWADIERIGSDILLKFGSTKSPSFVVDLSSLNYMGSAMVALIVRLWKASKERNGRMVVVNRDEMVLEVLKLAGLNKVWTIVETRQQALQALGSRGSLIGDESSGGGGWITSILGLLSVGAGGFALYALLNKTPQLGTQVSLGLLFGGAALGLILGLVAVLKGSGFPKVLGLVVMMAAVGIGVAGVIKMPEFTKAVPAKDEAAAPDDEESREEPATDEAATPPVTAPSEAPGVNGPAAPNPAGRAGTPPAAAAPAVEATPPAEAVPPAKTTPSAAPPTPTPEPAPEATPESPADSAQS
ncbi:MAG: STAS domain-containing protein [Planctomycetaceae bacterium]